MEIHVTMRDGSVWAIPAPFVAEQAARYYADADPEGGTFEEQFESIMADDWDLTDWASNNLNWSDVEPQARKVSAPQPEYGDDWPNADKRVVRA